MHTLNSYFTDFISEITPKQEAIDDASSAHLDVREKLEGKDYVTDTFLYGSYKRHTAVGGIKDVDIVLITNFDPKKLTPAQALKQLKDDLAEHYDDEDCPQYQQKSIRVDYPLGREHGNPLTLDIIPSIAPDGNDKPLLVPNRDTKEWESSHPKGHVARTQDLNSEEKSGGRFVSLVKLMKHWWKCRGALLYPNEPRFHPKGFWLECLTAEEFVKLESVPATFAEIFVAILEGIQTRFESNKSIPQLVDPGLAGKVVLTSMEEAEFSTFLEEIDDSIDLAQKALDAQDKAKSVEYWQALFGDKFGKDKPYDRSELAVAEALSIYGNDRKSVVRTIDGLFATRPELYVHADTLHWRTASSPRRDIFDLGVVATFNGKSEVVASGAGVFPLGVDLRFSAPSQYRDLVIKWQVVNTGEDAQDHSGLRGNYFEAKNRFGSSSQFSTINYESTRYTGVHWAQCFVFKQGRCIAQSRRFYVAIINPETFHREKMIGLNSHTIGTR